MGGKRRTDDGHLSKEDYYARSEEDSGPSGSFSRASEEELKKRRIFKASRTKFSSPPASKAPPGSVGNIFSTAAPPNKPSSSNPFARVQLKTPSTSTGPSISSSTPAMQSSSSLTNNDKVIDLNIKCLEAIYKFIQNAPKSDHSQIARDYVGYLNAIVQQEEPTTEAATAAAEPTVAFSPFVAATNPFTPKASMEAAAAPTTTTPLQSFALSHSPSPASTTTTPPLPSSNEENGVTTTVEPGTPSEWKEVFKVRARYYKADENNSLTAYLTADLRLESSKSGKHRMVMHNDAGLVKLNLAIVKGMPFQKQIVEKDGKKIATVSFIATQNEAEGLRMFSLKVNPANLEELHSNLTKLAAT